MAFPQASIAYHNYDIVTKSLTRIFADQALEFYGIKSAPVVRAETTELSRVTVDERRMDFVFYLADDSYLHLEFQTTASIADLERFCIYDVLLYEQKKKPIHTAVIYGSGIGSAPDVLDHGSVKYATQAVYMGKYDGDKIFQDLLGKLNKNEVLEDIDRLNLVFLPLMKSVRDRSQLAIDALELAKKVPDEHQQFFLLGCLVGIADKFIDKEYVGKMMGVLKMTRVFQEIYTEGMAEGRAEGRAEGEAAGKVRAICNYLDAKFGFASLDLQNKVKGLTSADLIDMLMNRIFKADSLEKARETVEEALQAQKSKDIQ